MSNLFKDPRAWALLAAASLTIMSNATIAPALPGLQALFASQPQAELLTRLLVPAPSLVVALTAPFMGVLVDNVGRKKLLPIGTLLYASCGTAGLYLPDLYSILGSRLGLGLAVAAIMTAQSALIGDYFSAHMRGRFIGYQTGASHFGGLLFVTVAGLLAAHDPRAPFWIYGLAILLLPFFIKALPEFYHHRHDEKQPGNELEGKSNGYFIVAMMAVGVLITMLVYYVVPTQIPYHLVNRGFTHPEAAGWVLGTLMITGGISGVLYGAMRTHLGEIVTLSSGYLLVASGFAGLALTHSIGGLGVSAGLAGAGIGFVMPAFMATALHAASPGRRGVVAGVITSSLFAGQFLSPLVSQPLVSRWGYNVMFLILAGALIVTGIALSAGLMLTRSRENDH